MTLKSKYNFIENEKITREKKISTTKEKTAEQII